MHGRAARAYRCGLSFEVLPFRQLSADLALWQLEQHRGNGLVDRRQVRERQQPTRVAERDANEPMQALIGLALVQFEMRGRMKCERTHATFVGVNPDQSVAPSCRSA